MRGNGGGCERKRWESGGRLVGDGGWRGRDIFVVLTALFL